MNQKKSKFERYHQNGGSFKLQQNSQVTSQTNYESRNSINQVLNGNLTFDCYNLENKFQKKINEKFISINRYSLWNLIAYYFIRIIQSLSDSDRLIPDLIYFIIMFISFLVIQTTYIIHSKKQQRKQQYTIFFIISCLAYINILSWQRIYVNTNSPSAHSNYKTAYENLDFLLNEYQIIFMMLFWMKWIWKCIIVIAVTILQSVLLFDEKYSQSLGIILMIIQIVSFYIAEYTNRTQFIYQNQKYRNLKQLVEIMNTKLPIGVAIFQKKHINPYEQQALKFTKKNKLPNPPSQIILPTARKNIQGNLQSDQEIRSLKLSLQQIMQKQSKEKNLKVQIDSSLNIQSEIKDELNVDIRFINTMLFQQVFKMTDQSEQTQQAYVDDQQQRLSQNNNKNQGSNNVKQFKKNSVNNNQNINNKLSSIDLQNYHIINGVMTESNNLFTKENQYTEANNIQVTQNENKEKKSISFNVKDSSTQQSVHAFLESLQVPQRQASHKPSVYNNNNNKRGEAGSPQIFEDVEDSIGFYTNVAEIRSQQNKRNSGMKTNFKQLIQNFFNLNEKDALNQQKYINFDKVYYNCQQLLERPRKETKPDIRTRNGTADNQKQYDIKITSVILNGEPALILMINDSTDRFIMQQMKESSEFKSQLLNYIQHIAKTPLNSIIQLSETMEQWFPLQPNNKQICNDIKDNLDIIKKNGLILHHQVQSIIDLQQINCNSKISLKTDLIDLCTVIKEVKELFQSEVEGKNLKFEIIYDEENIEMQTDENRLTQILIEMIGNSVKFTRENDSIKIEIELQKTYAVSLISISIIDSGAGMTPEQVAAINSSASLENMHLPNTHFRQGPGIGLEVSRKLIGLLGPFSKFNLKSSIGEGSQFKFWLYQNLNEKEFAEKSNKMMRKTSDLIFEKQELQSFDKFVISNRLQHMEIMVDPFSLHPQMMYSNKDLNHFLHTRRSSKLSIHSSYSPKQARTTEGGFQPYSSVNSHNQLSQLQNQFLLEQQILQTQIMKKRSLYKVNSPQIIIRKRDMTMNTYISESKQIPLVKYINPNLLNADSNLNPSISNSNNNFSNINVTNNMISPNNKNNNLINLNSAKSKCNNLNNFSEQIATQGVESSLALGNTQIQQKTNMSLNNDSLDTLLQPFRQFGRQHTLQMKNNQNSKFQRSNRKFLSNSYQITLGSNSNICSPNKNSKYRNQFSQQNINLQAQNDTFHKNYTAYFSQALDYNANINSESHFKSSPKRGQLSRSIHRCQSHEEQFTQSLRLHDIYKSSNRNKEEEEGVLDEEKEVDEELEIESNEEEEEESNQSQKQEYKQNASSKYDQRFNAKIQQDIDSSSTVSHNVEQNTKLSIDKQHLIGSAFNQSNFMSQITSQNNFDELDEFNQSLNPQKIRSFNVRSNLQILSPYKSNGDPVYLNILKKQDQFKSQFTFNTLKQTNTSHQSLQSLSSNQQENEEKQSIVSLHSNKANKSYEKSQYHSLTHISSSGSPPSHQTPRAKKNQQDQIIEKQVESKSKNSNNKSLKSQDTKHSKAIDLQNTLFKFTLEDYNLKNKSILVQNKQDSSLIITPKLPSPSSGISFKLPHQNIQNKSSSAEKRSNYQEKNFSSFTKSRAEEENSPQIEEVEESNNYLKKKRKTQCKSKNNSSNQSHQIIESLDYLSPDKNNQSKDDSKEMDNVLSQQNQQSKQKRRLKNQSTFEISHFNALNKINVLDNDQVHSSQVLDDQKLIYQQKNSINTVNTANNTPSQQPRQLLSNYQTATSRSSLGNRQVRVTLNTIMSHDIDQDIFDTLFPQDTLLLIVDDTTFNRIVLKQMFKSSQNLIIHEAINGQDAIDKIKILKETTNRTYNLIFMDLNMPIMDGFEALKQIQTLIKQNYIKWVPVVAVTAYDTEVENCRNKGFDGFISKPIRIKEMVRTLIRIISLRKVEEH